VWGESRSSQFFVFPLFPIPASTDNLLNRAVLAPHEYYSAALNILKKATQGHWGSWSIDLNAWGDSTSVLVGSNTCQDKLGRGTKNPTALA
jgi:hypothetical protein